MYTTHATTHTPVITKETKKFSEQLTEKWIFVGSEHTVGDMDQAARN